MNSDSQSEDNSEDDEGKGKGKGESQFRCSRSDNTWIVNQVRLKAQLLDIRPAYIQVGGQLPN
jgi:hypothetical protein